MNWPLLLGIFFGFQYLQQCADIKEELDTTKRAYLDLLQSTDFYDDT